MNNLFDKLNLRPQERRLVVVVAIVVFVLLNFLLVFPMFGDYGKYQQRITDAEKNLQKFESEIKNTRAYSNELDHLQGQGVFIPSEDAALRLYQEVNSQANLTGLGYTLITPASRGGSGTKSNAFFEETSVTVNIRTGEKELIDFLNRLTATELMIRAKSMDISPDQPGRMLLQGSITLVKSFQRKPPAKAAAAAAPKTNTAAKPVAKPAVAPPKAPDKPGIPANTNRMSIKKT